MICQSKLKKPENSDLIAWFVWSLIGSIIITFTLFLLFNGNNNHHQHDTMANKCINVWPGIDRWMNKGNKLHKRKMHNNQILTCVYVMSLCNIQHIDTMNLFIYAYKLHKRKMHNDQILTCVYIMSLCNIRHIDTMNLFVYAYFWFAPTLKTKKWCGQGKTLQKEVDWLRPQLLFVQICFSIWDQSTYKQKTFLFGGGEQVQKSKTESIKWHEHGSLLLLSHCVLGDGTHSHSRALSATLSCMWCTLQHSNALQYAVIRSNTLQNTATRFKALQQKSLQNNLAPIALAHSIFESLWHILLQIKYPTSPTDVADHNPQVTISLDCHSQPVHVN